MGIKILKRKKKRELGQFSEPAPKNQNQQFSQKSENRPTQVHTHENTFYQTNTGKNPKSFCWVVSTYYRY
jgi:hypothetical protein